MIKATLRWLLVRARNVWLCALVTFAALLLSLRPGTSEPVIRLTGLVLQLLGVLTVAWGISETRALFGLPSIASNIKAYFKAAPFFGSRVVTATGSASIKLTAKSRGYGTHGPGEHPTLESRLDSLEENVGLIHQRITGLEHEYDQELSKLAERIREENHSRAREIGALRALLEALGTGGIHISVVGAVWLSVGLILSTAAIEISKLLGNA